MEILKDEEIITTQLQNIKPNFTNEQKINLIKEFMVSGIHPDKFAESKKIGKSTFKNWRTKFKDITGEQIKPRRRYTFKELSIDNKEKSEQSEQLSFKKISATIEEDGLKSNRDSPSIEIKINATTSVFLPTSMGLNQIITLIQGLK